LEIRSTPPLETTNPQQKNSSATLSSASLRRLRRMQIKSKEREREGESWRRSHGASKRREKRKETF
jgi:hypothetical protein